MSESSGSEKNLFRGDSLQSRVIVKEVTGDRRDMGGAFEKTKLKVEVKKDNNGEAVRELMMVEKVAFVDESDPYCFGDEKADMPMARRYYERWKYLRSINIPTVSSMRVVDDRFVVMGDMTRDSSEFFGKAKWVSLISEVRQGVKRELTAMEKVFLSIDQDQVKKEIEKIWNICAKERIILPTDDPIDFLVHPDGSWEVLVLDLTNLEKRDRVFGRASLGREKERLMDEIEDVASELKKVVRINS